MLRFFKSNNPAVLFFVAILAFLLMLPDFISSGELSPLGVFYISEKLDLYFTNHLVHLLLLNFAALFFMGALVSGFNSKFIITDQRNFINSFVFVLVLFSFQELRISKEIALAVLFSLLGFNYMLEAYKREGALKEIFLSSFFIGMGSVFVPPFAWFVFAAFAGVVIFRTSFNLREWFAVIWGFLCPVVISFAFVYLRGQNLQVAYSQYISNLFHFGFPNVLRISYSELAFLLFYNVLILIGSYFIVFKSPLMKIRTKKYFRFFLFVYLVAVVSSILNSDAFYIYLGISAFPVSFLLTYFFSEARMRFFSKLLFVLILFFALLNSWGTYFGF